jgi:5,10-methylenetetrahydrofolate reductase
VKRIALGVMFMLAACVEEPTPKQAEKAAETVSDDELKTHRKSIIEAADEAAKLVEADSKEEIDAMTPETETAAKAEK